MQLSQAQITPLHPRMFLAKERKRVISKLLLNHMAPLEMCRYTDLANSNIQERKQDQTVPRAVGVKGLAQGPTGDIPQPTAGFKPVSFHLQPWCTNLSP